MRKKINLWVEGSGSTDWILRGFFESKPLDYDVKTIIMSDAASWGELYDGVNIYVRVGHPAYRTVPMYLNQLGIEYLYFIDDNFWEISGNSLLANHYRNAMLHQTLERYIRGAKIVITSSKYLKEYIERKFEISNVVFCQAPVDIDYIESLPKIDTDAKPENVLRIGYAGVPRTNEFKMVWPALQKIRADHKNVEIEFFGSGFDEYLNEERVTVIQGYADLKTYYFNQKGRKWDIGLAPLLDNNFTRSKTENKFREYGAMKIAGIYSDIKSYNTHVVDGQTGFLAEQNTESWHIAIEKLVKDSALRELITQNASLYAKKHFHFNVVATQWEDAINTIAPGSKFVSKRLVKLSVLQAFPKIIDKDIPPDKLPALTKLEFIPIVRSNLAKFKNPVILLLLSIFIMQIFILMKK